MGGPADPPHLLESWLTIYRLGRFIQILGLLILPIAIASELAGKVGLAQSMGVAAIGFVLFTLGRAIQIRSGHGSA